MDLETDAIVVGISPDPVRQPVVVCAFPRSPLENVLSGGVVAPYSDVLAVEVRVERGEAEEDT